jgi:hypothetical protein
LLLIIRQIVEKRWLAGNLAGAVVLLVTMTSAPTLIGNFLPSDTFISPAYTAEQLRQQASPCPEETTEGAATITQESGTWSRLLAGANARVAVLGKYRRRFAQYYPEAGSNIDVCVRLESVGDLLRYLPRAAAHGFFAPYPDMWLKRGSTVGLSGRVLSGMETVGLYLIELLAAFSLWTGRRRLPIWFIALVAIMGIVAHGLVIVNVAVLFRMRYVFSMLLIVLGAGGAMRFLSPPVQKRSGAGERG